MKNVTFIIGMMSNGGAERVISIITDELIVKGININIISIYGDKVDYKLNDNINYHPIICKKRGKVIRVIERISRLRAALKLLESDIIISFLADVNIYTILSTIFLKEKIIISERNDPTKDPNNKIIRGFRNIAYRLADGYVFQTEEAMGYFSKSIQKRSVIIENPLKKNLPNKYCGNRRKEIVAIARLSPQKNLKMLIDAYEKICKEYNEYNLVIYGEGPMREELEYIIKVKNLEKNITLRGFEKNIHEKIVDSAMFILSSDYEGISNAMLEALAIGLPVISTDYPSGGARRFIKSYENGLLIPVGNLEALYNAMCELIQNKELSEKFSNNSLKIRDELSVDKITALWIDYMERIEALTYE